MSTTEELEHLFSYGTLQIEAVQLSTFGRKLVGEPDMLLGYRQTQIEIRDPSVVGTSGAKHHLNAEFTGRDNAMTSFLYVYVNDADATYRRALNAGARSLEEPFDTPYGDRRCMVKDVWGNTWQIATQREER